MIKIYALFGNGDTGSPFRLGAEEARNAMAERFGNLRHYRQFERATEQLAGLPTAPYRASAELWLDDADPHADILGALQWAANALPEVFAGNPVELIESEEHNISGKPGRDSGFKATFLFNRKPNMALAYFHAYWRNHHGPIAAKTENAERYVQSHISAPERTYDGITELFWRDHKTALASMASEQMRIDQSSDAQNFVDGESLVVFMGQETP
jgi:uncharacterized protein (TIGR02118 family)